MLPARQRCLLSSPMDCSISSFSACGSARMEFGLRVVRRLRRPRGISSGNLRTRRPDVKARVGFPRLRAWTEAKAATAATGRFFPSPRSRGEGRVRGLGSVSRKPIASTNLARRGASRAYAPGPSPQPSPRSRGEGASRRRHCRPDRPGPRAGGHGSRKIRQGSPALAPGASISRISSARASANSLSSEESCKGSGVATSRPWASFDSLARR